MYKSILNDYLFGISNSLYLGKFWHVFWNNPKMYRLVLKICKYNFLMHFLPTLLEYFMVWFFGISISPLINTLYYPIGIFSILFHMLHYMDLVNMACMYTSKNLSNSANNFNPISLAITMSIYNLIIYLTTTLVNLIFHDRFFWLANIINFLTLTIYHSFYCFNNLWQHKKIEIFYRIDMHEKLWPYYMGYGSVATLLYLYSDNVIVLGLYNLYMILCISLPFFLEPIFPKKEISYPPIKLKIFSHLLGFIFALFRNFS